VRKEGWAKAGAFIRGKLRLQKGETGDENRAWEQRESAAAKEGARSAYKGLNYVSAEMANRRKTLE